MPTVLSVEVSRELQPLVWIIVYWPFSASRPASSHIYYHSSHFSVTFPSEHMTKVVRQTRGSNSYYLRCDSVRVPQGRLYTFL